MNLRSAILGGARRALRGTRHTAEYLCVARDSALFDLPARLRASGGGGAGGPDVTATWLLLGLRPVVIGIPVGGGGALQKALEGARHVRLSLGDGADPVATLEAERIFTADVGGTALFVYEGRHGEHRLLRRPRRAAMLLYERQRLLRDAGRRADPLRPRGNDYDQLRIGYSKARPLLAAVVRGPGGYNLFPIDVQGPVGEHGHAVSLRPGARVAAQLEAAGKLAVCRMHARAAGALYALGRHHMRELGDPVGLPLRAERSPHLGLPVPADALDCRELELLDIRPAGSHRMHLMRVLGEQRLGDGPAAAHLHLWFAMWLERNGHPPTYLSRSP